MFFVAIAMTGIVQASPEVCSKACLTNKETSKKQTLINVGKVQFKIEWARTQEELQTGLSNHVKLDRDSGMLFVYRKKNFQHFWMKGMHFPIDILWIRENRVVQITPDVPVPDSKLDDSQLVIYSSNCHVDRVLEINAGISKEMGIQVGDEFSIQDSD